MNTQNSDPNFKILKNLLDKKNLKPKPDPQDNVPFGLVITDHMLVCDFLSEKGGWQTPEIKPVQSFSLPPDALVFHYGQTIFEGMKAFRGAKNADSITIFRPEMNGKRLFQSAERLSMEPFPEDQFLNCVKELVRVEKDWVLPLPCSLYIRPALIALDRGVSYRASLNYRFFIILSVAKDYFQNNRSIGVLIERTLSRAAAGGSGEAKCGGNYASALLPMRKARELGAEQVLWLDSQKHEFVEEAGAMNVMFVQGKKIITPKLSGSILHGITRDSILKIGANLGYEMEESKININNLIMDIKNKKVTEVFACGTAAVVSPIGFLFDGTEKIIVGDGNAGLVSLEIKKRLLDIQTGVEEDKYQWLCKI